MRNWYILLLLFVVVVAQQYHNNMAQTLAIDQVRLGHLNVYHLSSKLQDVAFFLNHPHVFHIFGLSETRLKSHIPTSHLHIPNYDIYRKDASLTNPQHAGLVVYVHNSICTIARRRTDLESGLVESLWIVQSRGFPPIHAAS